MKRFYLAIFAIAMMAITAMAQNPVHWTAKLEMTSDTEGIVKLSATMDKGWHIYNLKMPEDGPNPTKISFAIAGVEWDGGMKVNHAPKKEFDSVFECEVAYWENEVTFTRRFKVTDPDKAEIIANVDYMCCNESSCRPPVKETFNLKPGK